MNDNARLFKTVFLKTLPVMAGYVVLSFGFGILAESAGWGGLWVPAMSIFIYAGSMQYLMISLLTGGASVLSVALTTLAVNARHLFYGLSMIGRYRDTGKYRPYIIFGLTDETYSLLCTGDVPEGVSPGRYYFFISLFNQCYWVAGSILGMIAGTVLPVQLKGVEFSMTALFITVFTEQWITADNHLPALAGLGITLLCRILFGSGNFLIPSMLLITLFLTAARSRPERREEA